MKSQTYIVGTDVANGNDYSAVSFGEYRGNIFHVLGVGTDKDVKMALSIAIYSYLKSLSWYKRIWIKLKWKIFNKQPHLSKYNISR